ncbi:sensor histidine kinase [Novosphingobium malaysiense]|nr:ATP-binding protein [Novosphingobium malaysiense]
MLFGLAESTAPSFAARLDTVLALTFGAVAAVAFVIAIRSWYLDFVLSKIFIAVDVMAFIVLTFMHTHGDAAMVVAALWLLAHVIFASTLRWQSGMVLYMALALDTLWLADIFLFEMPGSGANIAEALSWALFAVLETVVVVEVSVHRLGIALPRFYGEIPDPGLPPAASALGYAANLVRAQDAVLCWIDPDNRGCYCAGLRELDEKLAPAKLSFAAAEGFRDLSPALFDVSRNRAIISTGNELALRTASTVSGRALLAELKVKTGISIPVDGEDGRTWLILTGIRAPGWGHLHLAAAIRAEIAQGLESQMASIDALNSALLRLRRTVACDLHDSVAHSLAGARFLLVALQAKVGENAELADEIDTIKSALGAEHRHVRGLIAQLRETESDPRVRNLIEDIASVGDALALRWQIEVELRECDFRIEVEVWLSMELQQVVREAISNAVRHGNASQVTVRCVRRSDVIEIDVTDNGSGFTKPEAPTLPRSISERLGELGGSLEIHSKPGCTALQMSVPVNPN